MLNRFFDADNAWYLINFETGAQNFGSYGGRNAVHPNVANFVHPLVVGISKLATLITNKSKAETTEDSALIIGPASAALRSGFLFLALDTAGLSLMDALLATSLASFAFSSVLFGCLPESFVISSGCFAGYFWLAAVTAKDKRLRSGWWCFCGMCLSSITITNVVPFAMGLLGLLMFSLRDPRALRNTSLITAGALASTALCFFALTAMHGTFRGVGRTVGQLEEVGFSAKSMLIDFPRALGLTLVGQPPNQLIGTDEEHRSTTVQVVRFTYRDDLRHIQQSVPTISRYRAVAQSRLHQIVTLLLITVGILLSYGVLRTSTSPAIALYLLSLSHLAFHWILHSFFGLELFLYSQHWIVPLVIAIAMGLTLPGRRERVIPRVVVCLLLLFASIQTLLVMRILIRL
jgi:hypothetical protein